MAPAFFHHEEEEYSNNNTVCVMDGAGHVGAGLVHRLLQRGYIVHAAVQNHGDFDHCFDGVSSENKKKLKIFRSDLFDYQSLLDALRGCSGLFYAFEPSEDHPIYDEFMVDEEVRAAHNVLEACAQTDTIDKVVFTSSATAVIWRKDCDEAELTDLDERHWSDINLCRKFKLWHALSKTLAEKTAWALAMDRGVSMVSINAGLVLDADVSIKNPYLKGAAEMYEDGVFVTVDLDYLVEAQICVFKDISSYGRYLCFNNAINRQEDCSKLMQMWTSSISSSDQRYDHDTKMIQQRISNKKLNNLMVDFEGSSA